MKLLCSSNLLYFLLSSFVVLHTSSGSSRANEKSSLADERNLRSGDTKKTVVLCTVYEIDYLSETMLDVNAEKKEIPSTFSCIDEDNGHQDYQLIYNGSTDVDLIINSPIFNGIEPVSGEVELEVPLKSIVEEAEDSFVIDLSIEPEKVKVSSINDSSKSTATDKVKSSRNSTRKRRLTNKKEGDKKVSVFRVNSADDQPTKSAAELADDIFGVGSDKYNLRSGYLTCSGNKLDFIPGDGNGLVNGVLELYLDQNTSGIGMKTVENWAWAKLRSSEIDFPLDDYDHYIHVLPPNVNFGGAAAYAGFSFPKSVYNDIQASNYQVLLHEVGHNLGQAHSGKNGASYGDRTCWMGAHTYWDEGPAACFNAPKSWYLGWYRDQNTQVSPSGEGPISLKLVGIDDYLGKVNTIDVDTFVVVRLKEDSEDLFLLYNRAKGINSGVRGSVDRVTVVEQFGSTAQSWQLAELDAGEIYTKADWNNSGKDLIIQVCNLVPGKTIGTPDIANVVVYVEGEQGMESCDNFTFAPTNSPTTTPENIHVKYYEFTDTSLPADGLKSLTPYAEDYVKNIDFRPGSGAFATSGRQNNVAALFEGYLAFALSDEYYICITSDDGSKLFIDDSLVIDNDGNHGAAEKCTTYGTLAGVKQVRIEYFELGGGSVLFVEWVPLSRPPDHRLIEVIAASAFVSKTNDNTPSVSPAFYPSLGPSYSQSATPSMGPSYSLPSTPSTYPTFVSPGNVHVKYYEFISQTSLPADGLKSLIPYAEDYVKNIDFRPGSGAFATSGKEDNVAALFEGYLAFPLSDTYYICITSDDGSKVYIDGSLVIDNDGNHDATQECTMYDTVVGVKQVHIEYFERGGDAILFLEFVPLSRPSWFRLMRVIDASEFVPKPNHFTSGPSLKPSDTPTVSPTIAPTGLLSSSPTSSVCPVSEFLGSSVSFEAFDACWRAELTENGTLIGDFVYPECLTNDLTNGQVFSFFDGFDNTNTKIQFTNGDSTNLFSGQFTISQSSDVTDIEVGQSQIDPNTKQFALDFLSPNCLAPGSCFAKGFLGETFHVAGFGACFEIQLFEGGILGMDSSDPGCSRKDSAGQQVISGFSGVNGRNIYFDNPNHWDGTFLLKESSDVTRPEFRNPKVDDNAREFLIDLFVPSCRN